MMMIGCETSPDNDDFADGDNDDGGLLGDAYVGWSWLVVGIWGFSIGVGGVGIGGGCFLFFLCSFA